VADAAKAGINLIDTTPGDHPFPEQGRVRHPAWGEGLVVRNQGDAIVVLFDDVGYKTLSLPLVVEKALLQPL
jgi:ATP-dependent DNA helicase RecQ